MSDDLGAKLREHRGSMGAYIVGAPFCALIALACGYAATHARKNMALFGLSALLFGGCAIVLVHYGLKARMHRVYAWADGLSWSFGDNKGRVRFSEIRGVKATELNGKPVLLSLDTLRGPMEVPLGVADRDELIKIVVEKSPKQVAARSPASATYSKTR